MISLNPQEVTIIISTLCMGKRAERLDHFCKLTHSWDSKLGQPDQEPDCPLCYPAAGGITVPGRMRNDIPHSVDPEASSHCLVSEGAWVCGTIWKGSSPNRESSNVLVLNGLIFNYLGNSLTGRSYPLSVKQMRN